MSLGHEHEETWLCIPGVFLSLLRFNFKTTVDDFSVSSLDVSIDVLLEVEGTGSSSLTVSK